jgi:glycosyltransferase involved in cell wall biosynthesis
MKGSVVKVSLVICSRNRAAQLAEMLARLSTTDAAIHGVEVILVDSASDDGTIDVMRSFERSATFPIVLAQVERPGLGRARNEGIRRSSGDVICFTDDDCYLSSDYFAKLSKHVNPSRWHYGMGTILLFDSSDDARVANLRIETRRVLPARSLLPAGSIQGANMFFLRSVFEKAGLFDERMGAGTEFPCEDIEMATRASLSGFVGIQIPEPIVHHHHRRKAGSPEADATVAQYDFGRGAYYASLIARGVPGVWDFWKNCGDLAHPLSANRLSSLERELKGATRLLAEFNK